MSGEDDESSESLSDDEPNGPIAGERLAEGRRAQQLSVANIAKELHLDEYKVEALERNDFDVIGAPVFAKGHLRKYAQLVNVSEADVMADYYQLDRAAGAAPVVTLRPRKRMEISRSPWVATIVLITIAVGAFWWFGFRSIAPAERPIDEISPPQVEESTIEEQPAQAVDDQAAIPIQPLEVEQPAADTAETATPRELRLTVTYSGDSWTEITDANGRRLFFGLGTSGRVVDRSGVPPLNALFGNADSVSLQVNGQPFVIPTASRRGRIARLTISGT